MKLVYIMPYSYVFPLKFTGLYLEVTYGQKICHSWDFSVGHWQLLSQLQFLNCIILTTMTGPFWLLSRCV